LIERLMGATMLVEGFKPMLMTRGLAGMLSVAIAAAALGPFVCRGLCGNGFGEAKACHASTEEGCACCPASDDSRSSSIPQSPCPFCEPSDQLAETAVPVDVKPMVGMVLWHDVSPAILCRGHASLADVGNHPGHSPPRYLLFCSLLN
jgi:hypothetical protein